MADREDYDGGVIAWGPPPDTSPPQQHRRPWPLVAAQLRKRPGEPALIDDQSNLSLAPKINKGVGWWKPKGAFSATTRIVDGRVYTWAWYTGDTTQTGGEDD